MKKFLLSSVFFLFIITTINAQVLGTTIHYWDFADGLPEGWQTGITSTNNIAHWEYRGPNTTPDITVGSRGSCAGVSGQPLNSISKSNGFMIFDSNYWDDGDSECGNPGTGVDPAPHNAWMMTNVLDLSNHPTVVLTFQQQYRHLQTTDTKVEVSVDNGAWVQVANNAGPNMQSPNVQWKTVNISSYVGGQSNARIRFSFVGSYYWWLLDDIYLYAPNDNDIRLNWVGYTVNPLGANTIQYSNLQYDQYPIGMIPSFTFSANATNIGGLPQTNVRLNTKIIRNGTTETYNQTSTAITMAPGTTSTLTISPTYTNPAVLGDYKIYYDILQNESDQIPTNDIDSLDYTISPYTFARDEGPMVNTYYPTGMYVDHNLEMGNMFQITATGKRCHSLQVAIAEGTQPGAQIRGYIYAENLETLIAQTNIYTVNEWDLNSPGQEKIVTLHFPTPLTLSNNTYYYAAVGQLNPSEEVYFARSGTSPSETSFAVFRAVNAYFYSTTTPVVRMNIFNNGTNAGCTDPLAMNYVSTATTNDGSCRYPGCTNPLATNYDPASNFENGTCIFVGCTDPEADNYNPNATEDDGSCIYYGCVDPLADNYDPSANTDDGSCVYSGCTNPLADNYNPQATIDDGSCIISGCTDENAANYNPDANLENGSCIYLGCMDSLAVNYNPQANQDDLSCIYMDLHLTLSNSMGCAPLQLHVVNQTFMVDTASCSFLLNSEVIDTACDTVLDYTIELPGTYQLTYVYQVGDYTADTTWTIEVFQNPYQPIISYNSDNFQVECTNCDGYQVQWLNNSQPLIDSAGTTLNIWNENTYQNGRYQVIITDSNTACASASDEIFVLQPYFTLDVEEGCEPLSIVLTNQTDEVEGTLFTLSFDDGSEPVEITDTMSHVFTSDGEYVISLEATSAEGSGVYTQSVVVHPVITPVLVHVPNDGLVVCQNSSSFATLTWYIDGTIFNDMGPHSDDADTYIVAGTTEFGCTQSDTIFIDHVGIGQLMSSTFELYPNPASAHILIKNEDSSPYELEIVDMTGNLIYQSKVSTQLHTLDVSQWSAGIYLVKWIQNGTVKTQRLSVVH